MDSAEGSARGIRSAITIEQIERDRYQKLADQAYRCPYTGVDYATCTNPEHRNAKVAYGTDRAMYQGKVRDAEDELEKLRIALNQSLSKIDAFANIRTGIEAELEAVDANLSRQDADYEQRVIDVYRSVRDLTTAQNAEIERLRRESVMQNSQDSLLEGNIRRDTMSRFFRKLAGLRKQSQSANPFAQSYFPKRNPFDEPVGDRRNPFGERKIPSRDPFEKSPLPVSNRREK